MQYSISPFVYVCLSFSAFSCFFPSKNIVFNFMCNFVAVPLHTIFSPAILIIVCYENRWVEVTLRYACLHSFEEYLCSIFENSSHTVHQVLVCGVFFASRLMPISEKRAHRSVTSSDTFYGRINHHDNNTHDRICRKRSERQILLHNMTRTFNILTYVSSRRADRKQQQKNRI